MNMNSKEKGSVLSSMRRAIRTKSSNLPPFVVEFENDISDCTRIPDKDGI
jgi:hypothetical protein